MTWRDLIGWSSEFAFFFVGVGNAVFTAMRGTCHVMFPFLISSFLSKGQINFDGPS